jgi:hypothetical protein
MWNGISIIKNDKNHNILKILIWKKIILKKYQCIVQLNYWFYGGLFFNFNFDINMT